MRKIILLLVALICYSFSSQATVTISGGTTASAGSPYATLTAAITALNSGGALTAPVFVDVTAGHTETLAGKITLTMTGTAANPIKIRKSGAGANPVLTAYTGTTLTPSVIADGFFVLAGSDYVTIDGIDLQDPAANNTATLAMDFGYGLFKASATDGCQYDTIKNCTITLNRIQNAVWTAPGHNGSCGIAVLNGLYTATGTVTVTAASGSNSYNGFYSNTIQNCNVGFTFTGFAAASPFTLGDQGNDVGGNNASTGNTILNFGGGASATNPASGIFANSQWGLNVSYNTINNNNGSGVNHATTIRGIFLNSSSTSASANCNFNKITMTSGGTTTNNEAIENSFGATAASNTININNNTCILNYPTATNGISYGIYSTSSTPTNLNINNNNVTINTAAASGSNYGIYNAGAAVTTLNINSDTIAINLSAASTSATVRGIYNIAAASTCALSISNNLINALNYTGATGGSGETDAIYNITGTPLTEVCSGNLFNNLSVKTTGTIYLIYNSYSAPANGSKTVQNNKIVTAFARTAASGSFYGYYDNGGSPSTVNHTVTGNNFSNITIAAANTGTFNGIQTTDYSGSNPGMVFNNDTVSNVTCGTGAVTCMYINGVGGTLAVPNNINNNFISNISSASSGSIYGMQLGSQILYANVYSNNINQISTTGASSGMYGLYISGTTQVQAYKNNINNLSGTNASNTINGIYSATVATSNIYNNFVSNLRATAATGLNAIVGINVAGGTTANVSYNTVYLGNSGALTGGATFGGSGVYQLSTTALNLKSNIINVKGTGTTGYFASLKRSTGTAGTKPANITATNNIYNAPYIYGEGTTLSSATNVYYVSGGALGTADPSFNSGCGIYKNWMGETGTYYEDSLIAGSVTGTFTPTPLSIAEGNATSSTIPAITDDFNSITRATNSDIGALEYSGTLSDLSGPVITYTALPVSTVCLSAPSLSVTISDVSGVNVAPGLAPRLYYRKSSETDAFGTYPADNNSTFNGWKYVEATGTAPNFNFNFQYNLLTSPAASGDSITYFIIAQDSVSIPNVSKNTITFPTSYCPVSVNMPNTGAVPTAASKGFKVIAIPTSQPSTAVVTAGSTNVQVMRFDFPATTCGNLTSVQFNTNGTTNAGDITAARVYYTTTSTFATTTQFGTDFASPNGSFTINGTQTLSNVTPNYFWLVYDISCAAPSVTGNVVDAELTNATLAGNTVTASPINPVGTRTINALAITTVQPSTAAVLGGTTNTQVLQFNIPANNCGNLTNITFNTNGSTNANMDISKARVYYTTTSTFATTTQFGSDFTSPNGAFSITGSQALSTTLTNYFWLVYDLPCSATAADVIDAELTNVVLGGNTLIPATINPAGTRAINAVAITTVQPTTAAVLTGSSNAQILQFNIPASNCGNVTNITFNTNGSTNANMDISTARVYYTTTSTFANTTQFGSDYTAPNGTFTISGSQALSTTLTNYFWLVYDLPCAAIATDVIDAELTNVVYGGNTLIPATINPAGTRAISAAVGDNIVSAATAAIGIAGVNPFDISGKTLEVGEPSPILNSNGNGSGTSNYSWGTAAGSTYWYKLVVPTSGEGSSGNLLVRAYATSSPSSDAQIAVWDFPNMPTTCGSAPNFTGGRLLAANDDQIASSFATTSTSLNSAVRVHLTAGNTYYIQLDGYGAALPNGNVYVEDLSYAPYNVANNGLGSYFNPSGTDMRFAAYEVIGTNGWTYYYDNNATSTTVTDDKLLMAVNWSGVTNYIYNGTYIAGSTMNDHVRRSATSTSAPLATGLLGGTTGDSLIVWVGRSVAAAASGDLKPSAPYVTGPSWFMMNKYWNLIPETQPTASVDVRTYYSDADFTALQTNVNTAGGVLAAHTDMKFIKATKTPHYSNAQLDPSAGQAAITAGSVTNLAWTNTDGVETGVNQAQFTVTSFSGGGGGGGGTAFGPLAVKLIYFKGIRQNKSNLLSWKINNSMSSAFETVLEKSTDAQSFNSIYTVSNSNNNGEYSFEDATPSMGKNYYRLKMTETNGKTTYSSTVVILNQDQGFELLSLTPNPVSETNMVTLSMTAANNTDLTLNITDIQGKIVYQQEVKAVAGFNSFEINVSTLSKGIYFVHGNSKYGKTEVFKLMKN